MSLAIGKNGQNVRLAAKLTGWRIDVKSESEAKQLDGGLMLNSQFDENEFENFNENDDEDYLGPIE